MSHTNIIRLKSVDSTNNYAKILLSKCKVADGTVILAEKQYSGRGQGENNWESEEGENLTFSIILHPEFLLTNEQIILNKAIALAISDFIRIFKRRINVKIKWPNDIYIGDKKVAGILIENIISGNLFMTSIVGIGVNINQEIFSSDLPNPTSIKLETGRNFDLDKCLENLIKLINRRYSMLVHGKKKRINTDYIRKLYRFGEYHNYLYNGLVIYAKMTGVTDFGRLILQTENVSYLECDQKDLTFVMNSEK